MSDIEPEAVDVQEPSGIDPEPAAETAPEPEPQETAVAGWSEDDPAFQAAVARHAQAIVDDRLAGYTPPQQQQGEPLDLNSFLSPFEDGYGENLARFLADRDQYILGQIEQRLNPLLQREQAAATEAGQQAVKQFVGEQWNETRDGALTDDHMKAITDLADVYVREENERFGVRVGPDGFGVGPMAQTAARAALAKASETIRNLNRNAHTAGGQANIDQLAAVQSLPGDIRAGAAGHDVPPPAKTPGDLMNKYFGEGSAALVR